MDLENIVLRESKKKSRFVVSGTEGVEVTGNGCGAPIWGDINGLELVVMDIPLL